VGFSGIGLPPQKPLSQLNRGLLGASRMPSQVEIDLDRVHTPDPITVESALKDALIVGFHQPDIGSRGSLTK
jgi:hypothetical protein